MKPVTLAHVICANLVVKIMSKTDSYSHISLPINLSQGQSYGTQRVDDVEKSLTFPIDSLWRRGYASSSFISSLQGKSLRSFYQSQNELLECMADASNHSAESVVRCDSTLVERSVRRAILASNICNAFLLCAQLYAFISSSSFSMLAVFVDALLDMVSGLVVALTFHFKHQKDKVHYPVGRARLEPLGVIGMACLMTGATLVTLEQSIGALLAPEPRQLTLHFRTIAILLSALAIKASLFAYCRFVDHDSVQALAEDHFNDCLSNSLSLVTILLADRLLWWVDPVGAIFISCLIIRNWTLHTLRHCDQLLGKVASPQVLNVITFIACNHSPHILLVDTVRAYHVGSGIYAEVHIVLNSKMQLTQAHDIGESLQNRIEMLEDVERCFVHLDVEALHSPATEHKEI